MNNARASKSINIKDQGTFPRSALKTDVAMKMIFLQVCCTRYVRFTVGNRRKWRKKLDMIVISDEEDYFLKKVVLLSRRAGEIIC